MNILIENGRVIDPKNGVDRSTPLYVADGKVAGLGEAPAGFVVNERIDATGCVVCPPWMNNSSPARREACLFRPLCRTCAGP